MTEVTYQELKALVAPYGKDAIIKNTAIAFEEYADFIEEAGINTPLRKAHFLAQLAHESDHFKTTKEYSGEKKRYAPWYGRGLIQTTWEENYKKFYEWCQEKGLNPPDFLSVKGREQVARFPWAFLCAVWYWDNHNLNRYADNDDIKRVTKIINGGYNGLDDRIKFLKKAKKIFNVADTSNDEYSVVDIQKALVSKGYKIAVDGVLGANTKAAIKMFQKTQGLVPDGIVGKNTAAKLFK